MKIRRRTKNRNMLDSFNNAINGIIYAIRTQRNMRIHTASAIIILLLSLFFNLNRIEIMILVITVAFVLFAELLNTSIEQVVDIIVDEYHPYAKIVKDVAAGAVLVAAFNSVIIAYLIFFDKLQPTATNLMDKITNSPLHIVFIGLVITLISTLILKSHIGKGTPVQGGMPSGHSAISFSILTAIWLISKDIRIFFLSLILSILVVQSRVETEVHNVLEVTIGAFVGVLIMLMVFQIVQTNFAF